MVRDFDGEQVVFAAAKPMHTDELKREFSDWCASNGLGDSSKSIVDRLLSEDEWPFTAYFDTRDGGNYETHHKTLADAKACAKDDVTRGKALQASVVDADDKEVFNYNPDNLGGEYDKT